MYVAIWRSIPFCVRGALVTQRPVATRLGTVRLTGFVMVQGFLVHISEVARARRVAGFAPTCTTTLRSVVIHAQTYPAGGTCMTSVAVQSSASQQLRLWNMVSRLGQSALHPCRQVAAVVARLATGSSDYAMIHGYRRGKADLRTVA